VGQTILLEHGPKSLHLINIRDARNSKAFKRLNEKEKEEILKKPIGSPEEHKKTQKYGGL
jgi:hypothetical protein